MRTLKDIKRSGLNTEDIDNTFIFREPNEPISALRSDVRELVMARVIYHRNKHNNTVWRIDKVAHEAVCNELIELFNLEKYLKNGKK